MIAKSSKLTLKSLQTEMNVLREELKSVKNELNSAKEELKEVKRVTRIEKTEENLNTNKSQERSDGSDVKCENCDKTFNSKKDIKMHSKRVHLPEIKCKLCENIFERYCDLEVHIKANHEANRKYECETCGKTFALRWRLRKHLANHTSLTTKKCHYFNNKKSCPFEEIGCMFEHILSEMCTYGKSCSNKLCSYQHEVNNSANDERSEPVDTQILAEENESELPCDSDSEKEECDTCDRIFKNNIDLNEHQTNDNCGFGCTPCGEFFRYENGLKLHQQRKCT